MQGAARSTRSSKRYSTIPTQLSVLDPEIDGSHNDVAQFICIECSETFESKAELNTHRQSHVIRKQFSCSHCGRGFHHHVFLQMHERSHEAGVSGTSDMQARTCRAISTRSSKVVSPLEADVVHVMPPSAKPDRLLNSMVEFKKERMCQAFAPKECVTRRSHGSAPPSCPRQDGVEKKNSFEWKISKFSDNTVYLIDAFGNSLEILTEVFSQYTIRESEPGISAENSQIIDIDDHSTETSQKSVTAISPDRSISNEINVKPVSLETELPSESCQTETSGPHEAVTCNAVERDMPVCPIESVPSNSIPFDELRELGDAGSLLTASPVNLEKDGSPCEKQLESHPSSEHFQNSAFKDVTINNSSPRPSSIIQSDSMSDPFHIKHHVTIVSQAPELLPAEGNASVPVIDVHAEDNMDISEKRDTLCEDAVADTSSLQEQLMDSDISKEIDPHVESKPVAQASLGSSGSLEESHENSDMKLLAVESMFRSENYQSLVSGVGPVSVTQGSRLDPPFQDHMTDLKSLFDNQDNNEDVTETCELVEAETSKSREKHLTTVPEINPDLMFVEPQVSLDGFLAGEQYKQGEKSCSTMKENLDLPFHDRNSETERTVYAQSLSDEKESLDALTDTHNNVNSPMQTNSIDTGAVHNVTLPTYVESEHDVWSEESAWKYELDSSSKERSTERNVDEQDPSMCVEVSLSQEDFQHPSLQMGSSCHETAATLLIEEDALQNDNLTVNDSTDAGISDAHAVQLGVCEISNKPVEQDFDLQDETSNTSIVHKTGDVSLYEQEESLQTDNSNIDSCERISSLELNLQVMGDLDPVTLTDGNLENHELSQNINVMHVKNITHPQISTHQIIAEDLNLEDHDARSETSADKCIGETAEIQTDINCERSSSRLPLKTSDNDHVADKKLYLCETPFMEDDEEAGTKNMPSADLLTRDNSNKRIADKAEEPPVCDSVQGTLPSDDAKEGIHFTETSDDMDSTPPAAQGNEEHDPNKGMADVEEPDITSMEEASLLITEDTDKLPIPINETDVSLSTEEGQYKEHMERTPFIVGVSPMIVETDTREKKAADLLENMDNTELEACEMLVDGRDLRLPHHGDLSDSLTVDTGGESTCPEENTNIGLQFRNVDVPKPRRDANSSLTEEDPYPFNHMNIFQYSDISDPQQEANEKDTTENLSYEKIPNSPCCQGSLTALPFDDVEVLKDLERLEQPCEDLQEAFSWEAPNKEEASNDDHVSVESKDDYVSTSHKLSGVDVLLKSGTDCQDSVHIPGDSHKMQHECEDATDDVKSTLEPFGFAAQCLKCGRRLRRGRREPVLLPVCFKCRMIAKRQERLSNQETDDLVVEPEEAVEDEILSTGFSVHQVKQETGCLEDSSNDELSKPPDNINQETFDSLAKKKYKCQKCDKAFKIPALLAGHMKCHTLPHCLTCGCQMRLKYKTKRTAKRCQRCFQQMKDLKKEDESLIPENEDDDHVKSDTEDVVVSEKGPSSNDLSEIPVKFLKKQFAGPKLSREKGRPIRLKKGAASFQSALLNKRKRLITAQTSRQKKTLGAGHQPDQSDLSIEGAYGSKHMPKKSDSVRGVLGLKTEDHEIPLSVEMSDSFQKHELLKSESSDEDEEDDHSLLPTDAEKTHLCPQCGKAFKCNRSLHLHLLSHTATQCESCGCRLQKKRRAGRWSKKCRICRLKSKDDIIDAKTKQKALLGGRIPKDKHAVSSGLKAKHSKIVKQRKMQLAAKQKKEMQWMNMIMAVKGLMSKPRKKTTVPVQLQGPDSAGSVPERSSNVASVEDKASISSDVSDPPQCDLQEATFSGLNVTQKKLLSGVHKKGRKCLYTEKNIVKVEEDQLLQYIHRPAAAVPPVSIKEEELRECLECNESFPNVELLLTHQKSHIEDKPFTCLQCPQSFSKEQYLNMHVDTHAEERPFRCPECNKTFTRRNHLGVHQRVHTGARPFACPDCPCRFRQKGSLIIHRYTHRNMQVLILKPYQCSVCGKSFKQKERLVVHERLHTGECPFSCKDCDEMFPSKSRLYVHRKIHKVGEEPPTIGQNLIVKQEPGAQLFQCQDCGKICSTKASFVLHRKIHRSLASSEQNASWQQSTQEPFGCKDCDKVCSTKASLALHRKIHKSASSYEPDTDLKPEIVIPSYKCPDCGKVCATKASLVLHRRVHNSSTSCEEHTVVKSEILPSFHCTDCEKVCSTKASLTLHRKVHTSTSSSEQSTDPRADTGDRSFICKQCDKVCSTKASFVLHSKVHKTSSSDQVLNMEQESYTCKECNVVSHSKASFIVHSKIHKSSSEDFMLKTAPGKESFTCKDCDKVCSTKASFVLHSKVHKSLPSFESNTEEHPFYCHDCGKSFSSKGRLSYHNKIIHTGHSGSSSCDKETTNKLDTDHSAKAAMEEKPFSCPKCPLRFTRLNMLVRHKLMHGNDGVFTCVHCSKRFLFQKNLFNHLKVCRSKIKGKRLLSQKKTATKRKGIKDISDVSSGDGVVQKKGKLGHKKPMTGAHKEKAKSLLKTKKLGFNKEKSKVKCKKETGKEKAAKRDGEIETNVHEKQSEGKQESVTEGLAMDPTGKEKKHKDTAKIKKVVKKVPGKQKDSARNLKKWGIVAAAKKLKLQTGTIGVKNKMSVMKKKAVQNAKSGGKGGQAMKEKT